MAFRPADRPVKLPPGVLPARIPVVSGERDWYSLGPIVYRRDVLFEQTEAAMRRRRWDRGDSNILIGDLWPTPEPRLRLSYVTTVKEGGTTYCIYRNRNVVRYVPAVFQPPKWLYMSPLSAQAPVMTTENPEPEYVFEKLGRVRLPKEMSRHLLTDHPSFYKARMAMMPVRFPQVVVDRATMELNVATAVQEFESTRATPEFRRWFEAASPEVRNADDTPKVFFRGQTTNTGLKSRLAMDSFTDIPEVASVYSTVAGDMQPGSNVIPVYLDIKNPLTIPWATIGLYDLLTILGFEGTRNELPNGITSEEVRKALIDLDRRKTTSDLGLYLGFSVPKELKKWEGMPAFKYEIKNEEDTDAASDYEEDDLIEIPEPGVSFTTIVSRLGEFIDLWEANEDNTEYLLRMALLLKIDTFAVIENPIIRSVIKRLGYDGVKHMDTFSAEEAVKKLYNKDIEDIPGIESGDEDYDFEDMSYDWGHWTMRPLDRSQVWPLLSDRPYQEPARVAAAALLRADFDGIGVNVLRVMHQYPARGYEVREEEWTSTPEVPPVVVRSAYTLGTGEWIGSAVDAYRLWKKYGISQWEKTEPTHSVCSIGFSPEKQQWFGWSHRAIYGFKSKQKASAFAKSVARVDS